MVNPVSYGPACPFLAQEAIGAGPQSVAPCRFCEPERKRNDKDDSPPLGRTSGQSRTTTNISMPKPQRTTDKGRSALTKVLVEHSGGEEQPHPGHREVAKGADVVAAGLLERHLTVKEVDDGVEPVLVPVADDPQPLFRLAHRRPGNLDALPGALGLEEGLFGLHGDRELHLP